MQRELMPDDFQRLTDLIAPIEALDEARQFELVDLALPALRTLEETARAQFLDRMRRPVLVDNTLSLPELLLLILVEYRLSQRVTAQRARPVQLRAALESLLFLTPMDKPLLIRAAVAAIAEDGTATTRENLMLRALCATLDVPLPPLPSLPQAPQPSAA